MIKPATLLSKFYGVVLMLVLALALGIVVSNQAAQLIQTFRQPFTVIGVKIDPLVVTGNKITAIYDFERNYYCDTVLNLFILQNGKIIWRTQLIGGATLVGRAHTVHEFTIPDLPRGDYLFRTITVSTCSGETHAIAFPDTPFTRK